ncbi:unnamed protein product [Ostreobium quekettii]|uniref:Uncharacterized protein n=1 Tax=Ostreobium quekettii TaxID=121088 RepID=A0A8S1J240_9CHLO|nr:unnamed protein product [Ostreobium quekettii]
MAPATSRPPQGHPGAKRGTSLPLAIGTTAAAVLLGTTCLWMLVSASTVQLVGVPGATERRAAPVPEAPKDPTASYLHIPVGFSLSQVVVAAIAPCEGQRCHETDHRSAPILARPLAP